jgi:hypothetical protein
MTLLKICVSVMVGLLQVGLWQLLTIVFGSLVALIVIICAYSLTVPIPSR